MGTHCYIAKEIGHQQYESIYCQLDGYPETVGKLLLQYYDTSEKLYPLLALGDIYELGEKTAPDPDWHHNVNEGFQKGVTIAYGRDLDAPNSQAKVRSLDELMSGDEFIEFLYIFTANHEWQFSPLLDYDSSFRRVCDALGEETHDINMDDSAQAMKMEGTFA